MSMVYSGKMISTHTDEWIGAIDYCESLDLGGKNDWRMPNINELSLS